MGRLEGGASVPWLFAAFFAVQCSVLALINSHVPEDYMDEVFHGPQARQYCRGAFTSWHPKITTFPGIYYLGAVYGWCRWALHALAGRPITMDDACSTPFLRSLNVILSAACLAVLLAAVREAGGELRSRRSQHKQDRRTGAAAAAAAAASGKPGREGGRDGAEPAKAVPPSIAPAWLHALALAAYPLHWFFSFLFYTDVASLLFLLCCQLLAARRRYLLAALAGCAAVLCRQTNAVWAAFVLGEAGLRMLGLDEAVPSPGATGNAAAESAAADAGLLGELRLALTRAWPRRRALLSALWPLLLPPAAFAAFLLANGGSVVLGDRAAHTPVRHGAQLLYFGAWAGAMLWPQLLPEVGGLAAAAARRPARAAAVAAAAMAAAAGVAHASSLVHPYMLADNRHYVFYLWRRLLGRGPVARAALAPAYAAAWGALLAGLRRRASGLWLVGWAACLGAQLLPAWLLELRYFTPGLLLAALRLPPPSARQAAAQLATYAAINAATLYLFVARPYVWADGSTARFIW